MRPSSTFGGEEYRGRLVDTAYAQTFGHFPDQGGRRYWTEALGHGLRDKELVAALTNSQEYSQLNHL